MSTKTNPDHDFVADAIAKLEAISRDLPMDVTLTELQLVVERLSFSGLYMREVQDDDATAAEINLYFQDEVSEGMVSFVRWIASRSCLQALSGPAGRVFLDFCIRKYRAVDEVIVTTAVTLEPHHRELLSERLRAVHPEPARILFRTNPNVVAGFILEVGQTLVDRSLRSHMAATTLHRGELDDFANNHSEDKVMSNG